MKATQFARALHEALYPELSPTTRYTPSKIHFHIASLMGHARMSDVLTSNYDDLLEDAKKLMAARGRVRHFHGRQPQD